jgi:hypothetical protein
MAVSFLLQTIFSEEQEGLNENFTEKCQVESSEMEESND